MSGSYSVLIIDMFHYDPEEDYTIDGFPSVELANEFARRWVRDSVEELRAGNGTREELRRLWHTFGEDASVLGGEPHYAGSHELDFFIAHPATTAERDWQEIKKLAGIA
ncbi:MAG: hypothetical protein LC802_17475 [Acidobacteria bacterium]|nr:hypothetical protein [Acidobacteriota bacterium]